MPDLLDDYEAYRRGSGRKRTWTPPTAMPLASFGSQSSFRSLSSEDDGAGEAGAEAGDSSFVTATGSPSVAAGRFEALASRSASDALSQVQQRQNDHVAGESYDREPAPKRRRGVTGAIIEGAINGLMYGGAAALTAYSLWSSWNRKEPESTAVNAREDKRHQAGGDARIDEAAPPAYEEDQRRQLQQQQQQQYQLESIPGEFSYDPYQDRRPPLPVAASSAFASSSRTSLGKTTPTRSRKRHVYVSNRRRRPLFESARVSYRGGQASPASFADSPSVTAASLPPEQDPSLHDRSANTNDEDDEDEEGDDDEAYLRFQEKMAHLIAEGQAALQSKASDIHMDESEPTRQSFTPSTRTLPASSSQQFYTPVSSMDQVPPSPSRIPQLAKRVNRSMGSTASPLTRMKGPGEVNFSFAAAPSAGEDSQYRFGSPSMNPSSINQPRNARRSAEVSSHPPSPFVFGNSGTPVSHSSPFLSSRRSFAGGLDPDTPSNQTVSSPHDSRFGAVSRRSLASPSMNGFGFRP